MIFPSVLVSGNKVPVRALDPDATSTNCSFITASSTESSEWDPAFCGDWTMTEDSGCKTKVAGCERARRKGTYVSISVIPAKGDEGMKLS
jgi:hypothetical protein